MKEFKQKIIVHSLNQKVIKQQKTSLYLFT